MEHTHLNLDRSVDDVLHIRNALIDFFPMECELIGASALLSVCKDEKFSKARDVRAIEHLELLTYLSSFCTLFHAAYSVYNWINDRTDKENIQTLTTVSSILNKLNEYPSLKAKIEEDPELADKIIKYLIANER